MSYSDKTSKDMHRGHTVGDRKPKEGLIERTDTKDKQEIYLDRICMHTRHAVGTGKPKEGENRQPEKQERYSDWIGMHTGHFGGPDRAEGRTKKI